MIKYIRLFMIAHIRDTIARLTPFLSCLQRDHKRRLVWILLLFSIFLGACQADTSPPLATQRPLPNLPNSPISPVSRPPAEVIELATVEASAVEFQGCLIFASNRSGNSDIYLMEQSIDNLQQLTTDLGLDIEPDWSPDGSQIAFASNREGAGFQIYVMNSDGSNQRRVGPVQPGDNSHPSWSPDGNQIVFQSKRDTNTNQLDDNFDLYVINSDGSDLKPLVTDQADDNQPSWSPDGDQIAFLSERSGQDEIYLVDLNENNLKQLTQLAILKSGSGWSSKGDYVIFEGEGDLYAVNVETQELTKLVSLENSNEATPLWLQNEKLIAFSSDRTGNWELFFLNRSDPKEPTLTQITNDPSVDRSPDWFPCQ